MDDKQAIVRLLAPKAVLKAMTPEAERAVPAHMIEAGYIGIRHFPFRVGRESRSVTVEGEFHSGERPRFGSRKPNNDLYLLDADEPLEISREHFQIEATVDGYLLVDRCSACGTRVGSSRIGGGDAGGSLLLKDGDTIAIGTETTPYVFTFISGFASAGC